MAPRPARCCVPLLVVASLACSLPAFGADTEATAGTPPDEVFVQGRRLAELRDAVRGAEDRFFSLYNQLNSNDEYDIHCGERAPVGSRIRKRVCEAEFTGVLTSKTAAAVMGGAAAVAPAFITVMRRKEQLLAADVRRLVIAHPPLLQALADVFDARQALQEQRRVASVAGNYQ